MSVSMSKADGVTVLTLTSDPQSVCPPLCQILTSLCYSPVCCSVSQHLRRIQSGSMRALGTMQMMIGLFNISLAAILIASRRGSWWQMDGTGFPFWMGAFFILFGILCVLTEKFPSPCLVILNMLLHLAAVGFAIAAIVMYSINIYAISTWWMCQDSRNSDYYYSYRRRTTPSPTQSAEEVLLQEKCIEAKEMFLVLLRGINGVLIVLSVLELCVVISVFVLAIKMLRTRVERHHQSTEDPEQFNPLLDDDAVEAKLASA